MLAENNRTRYLLMALAVGSLIAGTWAGLLRLGWHWPALQSRLAVSHGPLMVAGFFGTLISLERAVAMGKKWAYLGPLMSGVGGLTLAFGLQGFVGPVLFALGSLWLVIIFVAVLRVHFAGYTVVMAIGALALLVGNLLWLFGWQVYQFVLWWAGFLVLTIAGERLELGRMIRQTLYSQVTFWAAIIVYITGLVAMLFDLSLGVRIAGMGLLGLGCWLLLFDIARRTVKQTGLSRYIAVCLLSGYVWLMVSGLMSLIYGVVPAGPVYDTMLHAIFLGFVFAMIFGHAPIIFPAVLELEIAYKPLLYIPLVFLHASLILRTAGEMAGIGWTRLWGGLLNVLAVVVYLGMIAPIRNGRTA